MTVFDLEVVDDDQVVGDGDEHSQQDKIFEVELDMLMDAVDGYAIRIKNL